jgi:hypothetical protein
MHPLSAIALRACGEYTHPLSPDGRIVADSAYASCGALMDNPFNNNEMCYARGG